MKKLVCLTAMVLSGLLFTTPAISNANQEVNSEVLVSENSQFSLKKNQFTLFLGGSNGVQENGTKAPVLKYSTISKYVSGFDNEKYDIKLKSSDKSVVTVSNNKDRIYPKKIGTAEVLVTIKNRKNGKTVYKELISVTVKKNAEKLVVEGLENEDEFDYNESIIVKLPATDDTDLRRLYCDNHNVQIELTKLPNTYNVTFKKLGDYKLIAESYQSEKYDGFIKQKSFNVHVVKEEADLKQTSTNEFEIDGGLVFEGMIPDDIEVYAYQNGVKVYFSGIEKIQVSGTTAKVTTFKDFVPGVRYLVLCDGEELEFVAAGNSITDVASIKIETTNVLAGKYNKIKLGYYTKEDVNITKKVADELDKFAQFSFADQDAGKGFFNGYDIYFLKADEEATIKAYLEIFDGTGLNPPNKVYAEASVQSKAASSSSTYTGNLIYSFDKNDDHYLRESEITNTSLALGDDYCVEALLEYSDGTYKSFDAAGITKLMVADQSIAMIGPKNTAGGYSLYLNNTGSTAIILYSGNDIVDTIHFTVGEKRKASSLKTSLNKLKLNTNLYVGDYLVVKADVYDQYGKALENQNIKITQNEITKKLVGEVLFESFHSGRLIINGWDCQTSGKTGVIRASISVGELQEEISFEVSDIPINYLELGSYQYRLMIDGSRYIDTAVYAGNSKVDSTFISAIIESKDGYFVGEDLGVLLYEKPTMIKTAAQYGIAEGESFLGILLERKDAKGNVSVVGDSECIIPSYMDLEFAPYTYGSQLPEGEYTISYYLITGGAKVSQVVLKDSVTLFVYDSEPEIEIKQISESYSAKKSGSKTEVVKNCFKFYLDGVDITGNINDVDYNESGEGDLFIKNITFSIPNSVYGKYRRIYELGKLIVNTD